MSHMRVSRATIVVGSIGTVLLFLLLWNGLMAADWLTERSTFPSMAPSPSPSEDSHTSDWPRYTAADGGYSIGYPPDWVQNKLPESLVYVDVAIYESPGKGFVQTMVILLEDGGWTFRDIIDNDKSYLLDARERSIIVAGTLAIEVSGYLNEKANPAQQGYYWEAIYIEREDRVYRIILVQDPAENYVDAFHGMLSTFAPASLDQ